MQKERLRLKWLHVNILKENSLQIKFSCIKQKVFNNDDVYIYIFICLKYISSSPLVFHFYINFYNVK